MESVTVPVQRFSQGLGIVLEANIHPHQTWPSFTSPANLNEDKVPSFPCSSQLVPIPAEHCMLVVSRADDLQLAHRLIGDSATEGKDVLSNDATALAHLLR